MNLKNLTSRFFSMTTAVVGCYSIGMFALHIIVVYAIISVRTWWLMESAPPTMEGVGTTFAGIGIIWHCTGQIAVLSIVTCLGLFAGAALQMFDSVRTRMCMYLPLIREGVDRGYDIVDRLETNGS